MSGIRQAGRSQGAGRAKGFTLLELCILVIGVFLLGSILTSAYGHLVGQAGEIRTRATLAMMIRGQENYRLAELGDGLYAGDFEELEAAGGAPRGDNLEPARTIVSPEGSRRTVSSRVRDGYRLDLLAGFSSERIATWSVTARPTRRSEKRRWYYADETGLIRTDVGVANSTSPPCL
jgi:hypothetical protein